MSIVERARECLAWMDQVVQRRWDAMSTTPIESAMRRHLEEQYKLFCKKNNTYGPDNILEFGEKGCVVRMMDKMRRIVRLVWDGNPNHVDDEAIEDTYRDLANYAMIALMVRRGEWVPEGRPAPVRDKRDKGTKKSGADKVPDELPRPY